MSVTRRVGQKALPNLSHLLEASAQALSPALRTSSCPASGLMSMSERCCSGLWATNKPTSSALLGIGYLESIFPRSAAKLSLSPGAHNFILGDSFSPYCSEVSSVGFFRETLKFSIY